MWIKELLVGEEGRVMEPKDWTPLGLGLTILMENLVGGRRTVGVGDAEVELVRLL
jgi:hypothetical protein